MRRCRSPQGAYVCPSACANWLLFNTSGFEGMTALSVRPHLRGGGRAHATPAARAVKPRGAETRNADRRITAVNVSAAA
ncbi:MAG: hypothetical protein JWN03_3223 [Nocardia sp.]|nr:hypothetical protein [Nocardia sp.]